MHFESPCSNHVRDMDSRFGDPAIVATNRPERDNLKAGFEGCRSTIMEELKSL